ncbi:LPS export ABC transporter periplasmic protein LptC [Spiribacter onubensis]|uniref:LPS export ABC transporter periplasmic protein LptC n=1 Tax=Spiribacter onubensis TaxID=3122420 RepID=A0ABV3S5U4_9GAMM
MRRIVISIAAIGIAYLLVWQLFIQQDEVGSPDKTAGPALTAYARAIEITATDIDGRVAWQIRSPAARFYDNEDFWQLDAPEWHVTTETGPPWLGEAVRGRSWADETRARLTGDVVMRRLGPDGETRLETQRLDLQIPERYAETDQAVTLVGPGYRVEGIGARAWLDEERIQLLENTRGRYDAASK